jgi:hypothetical protein
MSKTVSEILPGLFVGNCNSPYGPYGYKTKYTLIVNCTKDLMEVPGSCRYFMRIPVSDSTRTAENKTMSKALMNITADIHTILRDKGTVLIHCYAGISRSTTVATAYLMRYYGMTQSTAIDFVQQRRPIAFYHGVNFRMALGDFQGRLP